jgi:hypothetical protein
MNSEYCHGECNCIDHKGKHKRMGMRNGLKTQEEKCFLVFYDIDRELIGTEEEQLDAICRTYHLSYLLYKTLHGYHFISLTPVDSEDWGILYKKIKMLFHSDFLGQVLRTSRKLGEVQVLITKQLSYGEVLPNVYNVFASHFSYEKLPVDDRYTVVYETYWTAK